MELLLSYLKSMSFEKREAGGKPPAAFPFITISRQLGAGGHSLAEAILRAMEREDDDPLFQGWHIFDREICARILDDPKLRVSLRGLLNEEFYSAVEDFFMRTLAGISPQYSINKKVFQTVRTLTLAGKAIIVGRGAACYTRDDGRGLHLRLVAPEKTRLETLQRRLRCSEAEAKGILEERDASRRKLVQACFHRDIDDPLLYDAVWNTGAVPVVTIAELVVAWVKRQAKSVVAF